MCRRLTTFLVAVALAGFIACAACSSNTRYRVLSFFIDGVPRPGAAPAASEPAGREQPPGNELEAATATPPVQFFVHAPYRDNRCGGCHDANSGELVRSVEEGLCLTCHSSLIATARYVHGPVAVNGCTICHHYHTSPYPKLLLKDPVDTCLQCHDRDDLAANEHHASIGQQSCVECHNPHGGDNRFFMKRNAP